MIVKDPMTIFREMSMLDDKEQMISYLQNLERAPLDEQEEHGKKPQTNADRIRAMSDKELAHWINLNADDDFAYEHCCSAEWRKTPCNNKCVACLAEWLKQPAE